MVRLWGQEGPEQRPAAMAKVPGSDPVRANGLVSPEKECGEHRPFVAFGWGLNRVFSTVCVFVRTRPKRTRTRRRKRQGRGAEEVWNDSLRCFGGGSTFPIRNSAGGPYKKGASLVRLLSRGPRKAFERNTEGARFDARNPASRRRSKKFLGSGKNDFCRSCKGFGCPPGPRRGPDRGGVYRNARRKASGKSGRSCSEAMDGARGGGLEYHNGGALAEPWDSSEFRCCAAGTPMS